MKARNLGESFRFAATGMVQALRSERNMRIHIVAAILAVLLSHALRLGSLEIAVVVLATVIVIVAEMVNTALEHLVDMVTAEYHPLAAKVKNIAAGAVLTAAVGAAVVGIIIFGPRLVSMISQGGVKP
ncbi:MAG: Undecaprenol kinase [Firmicutes bacterium ADurb.BinA052]|nr:MAG: Undecaprenol kinase [Firmicutes bacterium ADurb.BinA052]